MPDFILMLILHLEKIVILQTNLLPFIATEFLSINENRTNQSKLNTKTCNTTGNSVYQYDTYTGTYIHVYTNKGRQLETIPCDIPVDTGSIDLSNNNIKSMPCGFLAKYTNCEELYLNDNQIEILNSDYFMNASNLTDLSLNNNSICFLQNKVFRYLSQLRTLSLQYNCIEEINQDTWYGLNNLEYLFLNGNNIKTLENCIFGHTQVLFWVEIKYNRIKTLSEDLCVHLGEEPFLELSNNIIELLNKDAIHNVDQLNLDRNNISHLECDIFNNISLVELRLNHNSLTVIHRQTFVDLPYLCCLKMGWNEISIIETGAFVGLTELMIIILKGNKLSAISPTFFKVHILITTEIALDFSHNLIQRLDIGSFSFLNGKNVIDIKIDLSHNLLSTLSWMVFLDPHELSCFKSILTKKVTVNINGNNISCSREQCWMEDLVEENGTCALENMRIVSNKCLRKTSEVCPESDECMLQNDTQCIVKCRNEGYGDGQLSIDSYVCPFQYLCTCIPCPAFNKTMCRQSCNEVGKKSVIRKLNYGIGCQICDCKCEERSCMSVCRNQSFETVNNTGGCLDCKCRGNIEYNAGNQEDEEYKFNLNVFLLIASSAVLMLFCVACCFPRALHCKSGMQAYISSSEKDTTDETALDTFIRTINTDLAQDIRECWIDPRRFVTKEFLGKGHFGIVWSGILQTRPCPDFKVAVKKMRVQVELDNQLVEDFLQEAMVMKYFQHPNVLSMIGVSIHESKPCVIMPLMGHGDLKHYLNKQGNKLKLFDLLSFALGVAKGMTYLEEQNFVHRDLAARNCLLDEMLLIKISDFNLTREMSEGGYYKADGNTKAMPLRWMSIEAIEDNKFSSNSDTWSYGILLWEIFSFGGFPYENIDNASLSLFLKAGNRLDRPSQCPDFIYKIMSRCWIENPEKRPSFQEILTTLNLSADKEATYLVVHLEEDGEDCSRN